METSESGETGVGTDNNITIKEDVCTIGYGETI